MFKLNLGNLEPKTLFYNTNGTGRDTYISNDSGGMLRARQFSFKIGSEAARPKSSYNMPRPKSQGKVVHYHSDGTGRDNYIVCDEGGFAKTSRGSDKYNFLGNLRSYRPIRVPQINANPDYFGWAQTHNLRTSKDYETEREKKDTIKSMVDRLSKPRVQRFKSVDFRILSTRGTPRTKLNINYAN